MKPARYFLLGLFFIFAMITIFGNLADDFKIQHYTATHCQVLAKQIYKTQNHYVPLVDVSYSVNGQTYTALVPPLHTNPKLQFQYTANYFLNQYQVNTKVPCYYNPSQPGKVLLERNFHYINLLMIFAIAGFAFMLWSLAQLNKKNLRPSSVRMSGSDSFQVVEHKWTTEYISNANQPITEMNLPPELKKLPPRLKTNILKYFNENGRYVRMNFKLRQIVLVLLLLFLAIALVALAI